VDSCWCWHTALYLERIPSIINKLSIVIFLITLVLQVLPDMLFKFPILWFAWCCGNWKPSHEKMVIPTKAYSFTTDLDVKYGWSLNLLCCLFISYLLEKKNFTLRFTCKNVFPLIASIELLCSHWNGFPCELWELTEILIIGAIILFSQTGQQYLDEKSKLDKYLEEALWSMSVLFRIYQNPVLLRAASNAFWTSCHVISKLLWSSRSAWRGA